LLRAKAEGAETVDMQQLINDIGDESMTPQLMVDILSRHTGELKELVAGATLDQIQLNMGVKKSMVTKQDADKKKMKNTALQQALKSLE
jgi:hypothetical protein